MKHLLTVADRAKDTIWAYSIHDHHLYPEWLGGAADGPRLRVRGYEHIRNLESDLFAHMKKDIPELTQKTTEQVRDLLRQGLVKQDDITDALVKFYRNRYPGLPEDVIRKWLEGGL